MRLTVRKNVNGNEVERCFEHDGVALTVAEVRELLIVLANPDVEAPDERSVRDAVVCAAVRDLRPGETLQMLDGTEFRYPARSRIERLIPFLFAFGFVAIGAILGVCSILALR